LPPVPEEQCACANEVCECLTECSRNNSICNLFTPFPINFGCFLAKEDCEDDCYSYWREEPEVRCVGTEPEPPTSAEIIEQCVRDCLRWGGSRTSCYIDCGAY
jgi:hypothetical protein